MNCAAQYKIFIIQIKITMKYPWEPNYEVVSESTLTVNVVDERGGQGHTSESLAHQSAM
jgi:hypothetical protein